MIQYIRHHTNEELELNSHVFKISIANKLYVKSILLKNHNYQKVATKNVEKLSNAYIKLK